MRIYPAIVLLVFIVVALHFTYKKGIFISNHDIVSSTSPKEKDNVSKPVIASKDIFVRIKRISAAQNLNSWLKEFDTVKNNDPECIDCLVIVSEKPIVVDELNGIMREIISHPAGRSIEVYIILDTNYVLIIRYGTENPRMSFPENRKKIFESFISELKINSKEISDNKQFTLQNGESAPVYTLE